MMAAPILEHQKGVTLILSGDHPLIKPETLQKLAQAVEHGATMAILSGHMDSPHFDSLGRIITDSHDNVKKIVEVKNATEAEKAIRHMNLGTYAVDNAWLWQTLKKVGKDPVTSEYYLTAIIGMAVEEGKTVTAVEIEDEHEAIGINTPEHLQEAEASLTASSQ
jgi:bifunctional UDP-N-acetylglucosamine pyrophosphorylase/glucosamine-1-phosphate N-acetyltransferase